nr:hypothetical protein [uncultured Agathobaculum sp.]
MPQKKEEYGTILYGLLQPCRTLPKKAVQQQVKGCGKQQRAVQPEIDPVVDRIQTRSGPEKHAGNVKQLHEKNHDTDQKKRTPVFQESILPQFRSDFRRCRQKFQYRLLHKTFLSTVADFHLSRITAQLHFVLLKKSIK